LRLINPYKEFNRLVEQETYEPIFSWGLRMAIAATLPMIWGVATGNIEAAIWISLTAELISWVELKGSFTQSLGVLAGGVILAMFFTALGSITGNIWLSVAFMLIVGFLSGLFKNLGDRSSGLATSVYVMYIIANAYPTHTVIDLRHRMAFVFLGGMWNLIVGMSIGMFMPVQQPYRRMVANIWRSIAGLTDIVARGWDGSSLRSNVRDIYQKEKNVRSAMDTSFHFYETMAHQASKNDPHEYQLAQVRKATSLVAAHITAISEELDSINIKDTDNVLKLKIYAALKAVEQTAERMAAFIVTLKPEDELLVSSRISRCHKLIILLKEYDGEANREPVKRIIQLLERSMKLIESCISRLEEMGDDLPVFRSYSLVKTIFILHPKYWMRNLQLLFNLNTLTARYAMRIAIAAGIAMFIDKWFAINHGYWLPFTVILISQPYFGATFKKAIDRILGTLFGGLLAGLLLRAHMGVWLEIALLFVSFVMMVYYLRKNYAISAFFITFSLVLQFNIEAPIDQSLIITRELATLGGALLAVLAGFVLLPHWDSEWLPRHLADAINSNFTYFNCTFFNTRPGNWTKLKRDAESKNSNAFDSFNRYMQEPTFSKRSYAIYYHLITHNVRITRELNNIHLEQESTNPQQQNTPQPGQQQRINLAFYWFTKNAELLYQLHPDVKITIPENDKEVTYPVVLNTQQSLYLDRLIIELKAMNQDLDKLTQRVEQ